MKNKLIYLISALIPLLSGINRAEAFQLCGKAAQGEILLGKAAGASEVIFNARSYPVDSQGRFLLAFDRDQNKEAALTFRGSNNQQQSLKLTVSPTAWDIQNLTGVPPRKVTPSNSDMRAIEKEQKLVRAGQQTMTTEPLWEKGFIQPVQGRISGNFGGQRIMNGIKKNPHAGMDIAVPEGTPVAASSDGIVTLAAADLFYSGNVVIIDHGYGLHTIYAHLLQMDVKRGDRVKQGDTIGLSGKTGRVTGPHLHWGASVNGVKFNPASLLNMNKADDFCFNL